MPEKKPRATKRPPDIETKISEILVAKNRSVEPYFHLFSVSPENVAQDPLGLIMGVFSVSDRSDSSAYVGNIASSVARKEYYANLRRDPTASFEATLHRTNIALAELVRNGETGFMGHLHGALAVISGNEIHFSTTGQAAILLYRDGTIMDISEGLASEEAETHPLKTFVEISSGRLLPGDCVLLVTPELFSILPVEELGRNAKRLVPEGAFARFLETAMINELKGAAALVISVSERAGRPAPAAKRKRGVRAGIGKEGGVEVPNVWGETPWRKEEIERARTELAEDLEVPEKIPEKAPTGNDGKASAVGTIYVDGESAPDKEEHPLLTEARWKIEEWTAAFRTRSASLSASFLSSAEHLSHSAGIAIGNLARNFGKTASGTVRRTMAELSRKATNGARKKKRGQHPETTPKKPAGETPRATEDNPILARALAVTGGRAEKGRKSGTPRRNRPERKRRGPELPDFATIIGEAFRKVGDVFARTDILGRLPKPGRRAMIIAAVLAFVVTLSVAGIRRASRDSDAPNGEESPVVVIEEPEEEPSYPPEDEPEAVVAAIRTVAAGSGDTVVAAYLDEKPFIVTRSGIVDGETGDLSAPPSRSPIVLATAMDDLSLIFLLTDSGELFSYAPSNGAFSENELPMPEGIVPAGIASYLTYIYLLDGKTGAIYRFPRVEGGFDEPREWTKRGVGEGGSSIAVNGNVYIAMPDTVLSLSGGSETEGFSLGHTGTPVSVTAVCADSDDSERFAALDTENGRVILYAIDGRIVRQYFDERLRDGTSCALGGTDGSGSEVAVTTEEDTLIIDIAAD